MRRSSWSSSFVTALIGWNGFATVAALAFGRAPQLGSLLPVASACAVLQVLALRARLRLARRPGGVAAGAIAGAASALVLAAAAAARVADLGRHPVVTLLVAAYIGAPVGAFLSYFRADDARIEASARAHGRAVDYGRDAHWLDPFAYGAAAYLAVFVPRAFWSGAGAAIVGAMVGVVAAGVSHFFLARLRNAPITIPIAAVAGALLGAVTGLLLRAVGRTPLPAPAAGALAGMVCFAITAAVGHRQARRERAGAA
ncbi:MAG TPA: hypothetical protein VIF57_29295 [Polyangia bacterium]